MFEVGFAGVFRRTASKKKPSAGTAHPEAGPTIKRAIKKRSKPYIALEVLRSIREGAHQPPKLLQRAVAVSVKLARREAPSR